MVDHFYILKLLQAHIYSDSLQPGQTYHFCSESIPQSCQYTQAGKRFIGQALAMDRLYPGWSQSLLNGVGIGPVREIVQGGFPIANRYGNGDRQSLESTPQLSIEP